MAVDGVRLTLPDGTEFFGRGGLQVQVEHQRGYLLEGGNTVLGYVDGLFEDLGAGAVIGTRLAQGHIGAGGGSRTIEVDFRQWEGSTDSWGPASSGDSIQTKLSVLDAELARSQVDSLNPATLEFAEFSSSSATLYDAIPVVIQSATPSFDFGEGGSVSSFSTRLTLQETIDLSGEIDGSTGVTADYRLTPDGESSPRVPLPEDTLGAGGRQTGGQTQGRDEAPSSLVDTNGTGSDPRTTGPSINPESVRLYGAWRGSNAKSLANTFKTDFVQADAVEKINITAPGRSSPDPLEGTYVLGSDTQVDPLTPAREGGVYAFILDLRQA